MRRLLLVLAILSGVGLFAGAEARGQSNASAKVRDPQGAAELTTQALALLEKGEDLSSDQERLAAYTEGEKLARAAVELDDTNADAYFAVFGNFGRRLMLEGGFNPFNLLKVNQPLDRCLQLNPDHSDALAARGGMYRQIPSIFGGSLKKSESDLKRSIELDPEATGARIELARTYQEMGKTEKVVPLLEEALYWAEKLHKPRRVREARAALAELPGN